MHSNKDKREDLKADIVVIGSGPGGAITGAMLAKAGRNVMLIEEGCHLSLESAPHYSQEELSQKYRNGGITVGMGSSKVAYVEGRCVGGGSEINRGLYHRTPPEILEKWRREYHVENLLEEDIKPHFEAIEQAYVARLPVTASPASLKLHEGAVRLGWTSMEVPRLVKYTVKDGCVEASKKQSMTETYIPRMLKAGGRLMPNTRVRRLMRVNGQWRILVERYDPQVCRSLDIYAKTVFVSCGAVQTPALLRRSGFKGCVGQSLAFHPMIKVIAQFPDEMNPPGMLDPVHQVKEFDPRFSMGCSVSSRPLLALTMMDHPKDLANVQHDHKHMGLYYTQTSGGYGSVHVLPGYRDPLVRVTITQQESQTLAEALRRLCECLFAAGAVALYPGISGFPVLHGNEDLSQLPARLPKHCANLSTLHLFSSCRMGQDRQRCVTDSFGQVYNTEDLYISDSSILCGPTIINPQGTVMAVAHRNVMEYLQRSAS